MSPDPEANIGKPAKGGKKNNDEKKGKGGLIVLAIVLVLVGAAVAVIALDIGGVRENHIMPYLRNAPLIGSFFPETEEEEPDPLYEMSEDELRTEIINLRNQVASLENQRNDLQIQLNEVTARNAHLMQFEARWNEYRLASARFTQLLAHNEPIDFVEFFYAIVEHDLVPQDILAAAFAEAQAINMSNDEFRSLVSTYNNMDTSRAAEDLERLMLTNTPLSIRLLRAMGATRRAEIFDELEYTTSTTFTILLSTEPPTFAPLVPPPYLPEIFPVETPPAVIPFDDEEYEYEDEDENGEDETEENGEEEDPAEELDEEPATPDE